MANPNSLVKMFKGMIGSSGDDVLDTAIAKHLDDFVRTSKGNLDESFPDFIKKLKESHDVKLSPAAKDFFDSNAMKFLLSGKRLAVFDKFGDELALKLNGSEVFTKSDLDNMLTKLADDAGLIVKDEAVEDISKVRFMKDVVEESLEGFKTREELLKSYRNNISAELKAAGKSLDGAEIDKLAREELSQKMANIEAKPSVKSGATPGADIADDAASTAAKVADDGGNKSTLDVLKTGISKVFNSFSSGDNSAKLLAEREWYQNTFGAWRSYAANIMEAPNFLKAIRENDRGVPLHLPNFGISRIHMRPRIKDFDNALKETGALDKFVDLQSELKKVTHAFSRKGEYEGEVITHDNVVRKMHEVFTSKANQSGYRDSLKSFHDELLKMREDFEKIVPVVNETKKYSFKNGMDHLQKARLLEWANDNIERVEYALNPEANKGLMETIQIQIDKTIKNADGNTLSIRTKGSETLNAIIDSGIGERVGSSYYERRFGKQLADAAEGGFARDKKGNVMLGDNVLWRVKHDLEERLTHAYNNQTRVKPLPKGDEGNLGAKLLSPFNLFIKQLNPEGSGGVTWGGTGDLRNFKAAFKNFIKFGGPGETTAVQIVKIMKMMEGEHVLKTMPDEFSSAMDEIIKSLDNPYDIRAVENIKEAAVFTYDGSWPGSQRYMADKFGADPALYNLINKVDKGASSITWKDAVNPLSYTPYLGKTWNYVTSFGGMSSPATDLMWQRIRGARSHYLDWAMGRKIKDNLDNKELLDKGGKYVGDRYMSNLGKKSYTAEFDRYTPLRFVYRNSGMSLLNPANWNNALIKFPVEVKTWHLMMPFAAYATANTGLAGINYMRTDSDDQANPVEWGVITAGKWARDTATPAIWFSKAATYGAGIIGTGVYSLGHAVGSTISYAAADEGDRDDPLTFGKNLLGQIGNDFDASLVRDLVDPYTFSLIDKFDNEIVPGKEFDEAARAEGKSYDTLFEVISTPFSAASNKLEKTFGDDTPEWKKTLEGEPDDTPKWKKELEGSTSEKPDDTDNLLKTAMKKAFESAHLDTSTLNNHFANKATGTLIAATGNDGAQKNSAQTDLAKTPDFVNLQI